VLGGGVSGNLFQIERDDWFSPIRMSTQSGFGTQNNEGWGKSKKPHKYLGSLKVVLHREGNVWTGFCSLGRMPMGENISKTNTQTE